MKRFPSIDAALGVIAVTFSPSENKQITLWPVIAMLHFNNEIAHEEEIRAWKRAYKEAHQEQVRETQRAYIEAHEEQVRATQRAYKEAHQEQFAFQSKPIMRLTKKIYGPHSNRSMYQTKIKHVRHKQVYKEVNRDTLNALQHIRRQNNKEQDCISKKQYRECYGNPSKKKTICCAAE